jgi:hypothetical protein
MAHQTTKTLLISLHPIGVLNMIAQTIDLDNKKSMALFPSIKPRNVKKCRMPPLHITGSSQNWYNVIEKIRHWQQNMTREEQDAEIARGSTFMSGEKAAYRRNKAHLMENRPLLLPNNVPLSTPAAHEARCSSARQNSNALEELTQREVARTSDPIIQQNARTIAGLGTAPVSLAST